MTNADFWKRIDAIINGGFATEGLQMLDYYAELFINGRVVYKRFSPFEQHGCSAGGATHVIASLLAAAKARSDSGVAPYGDNFKREIECGAILINTPNLKQCGTRTLSTDVEVL